MACALLAVRPAHRRIIALKQLPPETACVGSRRLVRRGAVLMIAGVAVYSSVGAITADIALERNGHAKYGLKDHLRSQAAVLPVVLLTALPILTVYFDKLGLYLAPRGLGLGAITMKHRAIMFGIAAPLLVDTMLISHMYNQTGYLTERELLLWAVLLAASVVGAWMFIRSRRQAILPVSRFLRDDSGAMGADELGRIIPLSLDEIGEIGAKLDNCVTYQCDLIEQLRDKESRLLEAERVAKIGRWKAKLDGTVICSDLTLEICNLDRSTFGGTTREIFRLIHQDDRDTVFAARDHSISTGEGHQCVYRLVRPDGNIVHIFQRGEAVKDKDGVLVGFSGILQDVTETVELQDQLRHAQKLESIGRLTGGIAHDFNNVLAVVLGSLELIKATEDGEDTSEFLDTAIEATRRGSDLTKSMLSFARQANLSPKALSLTDTVRDIEVWARRVLPETIEVDTRLPTDIWDVEADPNSTQNALLNLIVNARDAMPKGGRLRITTANVTIDECRAQSAGTDLVPGRYVKLSVSDEGHGVSPDKLEKIFDPFYTTKPVGEGSGLGLSMIHGFMKQSGGAVRVYSEVGVGTTFTLYFKAANANRDAGQTTTEAAAPIEPSGARILVVEDDTQLLAILTKMLSQAGYQVQKACSGKDAIWAFETDGAIDLVITDIMMPGRLNGARLARRLREKRRDLPVVFLSGYVSEVDLDGGEIRPDDIRLTKPIDRNGLIAAVESAIDGAAFGAPAANAVQARRAAGRR